MLRVLSAMRGCSSLLSVHLADNGIRSQFECAKMALKAKADDDNDIEAMAEYEKVGDMLDVFDIKMHHVFKELNPVKFDLNKHEKESTMKAAHLNYITIIRRAHVRTLCTRTDAEEAGHDGCEANAHQAHTIAVQMNSVAESLYAHRLVHGDNEQLVAPRYELLLQRQMKLVQ